MARVEKEKRKKQKKQNRRRSVYDVKGNTSLGIQKVEAVACVVPAMCADCSDTLNCIMIQVGCPNADNVYNPKQWLNASLGSRQ